jgi:hypothetical protein
VPDIIGVISVNNFEAEIHGIANYVRRSLTYTFGIAPPAKV